MEDAAVVRRIFELGPEAGPAFFDLFHPDVVVENVAESPITGPYHGHEGLVRWRADIEEVVDDFKITLDELHDLGEGRILTTQVISGSAQHAGIEFDYAWASLWRVEEGRIRAATGYGTKEEALEAIGFSE